MGKWIFDLRFAIGLQPYADLLLAARLASDRLGLRSVL
jgi:hypothetical protein